MSLHHFNRKEFLQSYWNPRRGEQLALIEPTQGGKTHTGFDLLNHAEHVNPPIALVMKPRDPTPAEMTARWHWKETPTWPPPYVWPWQQKPPGYTLWPKHSLSLDPASLAKTEARIKAEFEKAIMDAYMHGDRVVFADEIFGLLSDLKMEKVIRSMSNRGSGMGATLWYALQKPAGTPGTPVPGYLFNNPTHLFLGYDPVAANRKRFAEIGGINTDLVMEEVQNLQVVPIRTPHGTKFASELLYINKNGPRGGYMCIVEPL